MREIWVVADHQDGQVKPLTLEALTAARGIAPACGATVSALILCGNETDPACEPLFHYGADRVTILRHAQLERYSTSAWLAVLRAEVVAHRPRAVLMPATVHGKELLPALAATVDGGLATDIVALQAGPDANAPLRALRPVYAGKALSALDLAGDETTTHCITLRPNLFRGEADVSRGGKAETRAASLPAGPAARLRETLKSGGRALDITEARVVVSGGLGMQKADNFRLLEELASTLHGAVGASRPVVDNGWRPYSDQVGQTGRTVSPTLYIACGISGAVQHLAGMASAKCIVAVNKDPNAPIFSVANYGIAADAVEFIPLLTEALKK